MSRPPAKGFELDADEAEALTGGRWFGKRGNMVVRGAAIDSRKVRPGAIFACFDGEHVDGHDYAEVAVGNGAALVLASKACEVPVPLLLVDDVSRALGQFAQAFRQAYSRAVWIGLTGSNGKTTVKEMLVAACRPAGVVHATRGNLNNHLGVPLTILNTPAGVDFAIVEMGANDHGEIAYLTSLVQPDVAAITSIGPAHLEGFGSIPGVARAKGELFAGAPATTPLFLGSMAQHERDNPQLAAEIIAILHERAAGHQLNCVGSTNFPIAGSADADGILMQNTRMNVLGQHNIANAHLAWYVAQAAGVSASQALTGLSQVEATTGRLSSLSLGPHTIYDDSYNANAASMIAGLNFLARLPGACLAVLGGMGELGDASAEEHRRVGAEVARLGLALITVGPGGTLIGQAFCLAGGRDYEHCIDADAATAVVLHRLTVGPRKVLIKASRAAQLDQVVRSLQDKLEDTRSC